MIRYHMCLILLTVMLNVVNGMACPCPADDSTIFEENMAYACENINWRNSLGDWKRRIEIECSVNDTEEYWRSLFECPDFSDINCLEQFSRQSEKDLFDCTIVTCKGGRYTASDQRILTKTWRQVFKAHKKLMLYYSNNLTQCLNRGCPDLPTSSVSTHSTEEASSPVTSPATEQQTDEGLITTDAETTTSPTVTSGVGKDTTDDEGWTVIQRRGLAGGVDFYRNWTEYVNGFGDSEGEFWLGLERMHQLTKNSTKILRVEMILNATNEFVYAEYYPFVIESAAKSYRLSAETDAGYTPAFSGNTTNGLNAQFYSVFATYDNDNEDNCAENAKSGWWFYYGPCAYANLNGIIGGDEKEFGFMWDFQFLLFSEMKIRDKPQDE